MDYTYITIYNNKKTAIYGHNITKFNQFLEGCINLIELLNDIKFTKEIIISDNINSLLLI
jgi:hypothetical protein